MNKYEIITAYVEDNMALIGTEYGDGDMDAAVWDLRWHGIDHKRLAYITTEELTHLVVEEVLRREEQGCLCKKIRDTVVDILEEFNDLFEYMPELFTKPVVPEH